MLRKCVIALSVAAILVGSVSQSKANVAPVPVVAVSSAVGAGVFVTGGFIGVAAVLCIYDFILKFNGVKNWDGTPKVKGHGH